MYLTLSLTIIRESVVFPMTWEWVSLLLATGLFGILGQVRPEHYQTPHTYP